MAGKKEKLKSKKKRLKFPGWLKKKPYWMVALLAEGILLMLSVLFALVLNERRAEFQRTREAEVALEAIKSELQENIESLDRAKSHHHFIRDTLQYYESKDMMPPVKIYFDKGLFQPAYLFSTAWETSVQTGVVDAFTYELNLELSDIYKDQAQYEELGNRIVQETYINILNRGSEKALRDNFKNWSVITWDFSNREKRLKEKIETALSALESYSTLE